MAIAIEKWRVDRLAGIYPQAGRQALLSHSRRLIRRDFLYL